MKKPGIYMSIILLFLPVVYVLSQDIFEGEQEIKPKINYKTDQLKLTLRNCVPMAQNTSAKIVSYPARGLLFNIAPSYSKLNNKELYSDTVDWNAKGNFGINIEAGYFIKLNRIIGIGGGLGYSYFNSEISIETFQDTIPNQTDYDKSSYTLYKDNDELTEKLKISFLDIPVYVEFGNPNIDKIGFYGRIGFKASFTMSSKLKGEGHYTSWGYYDSCHVELRNIPELGYYTNKPAYDIQEKVDIKPVTFSVFLSGGLSIPVSNFLIFKVGANFNFGLSELFDWSSDSHSGLEGPWEYIKLLDNSSKTSLRSFGLEVGLIYNLRLY